MDSITTLEEIKKELSEVLSVKPVSKNLQSFFDDTVSSIKGDLLPSRTPTLIHLCGIVGSGKTTFAKSKIKSLPNYYYLNFDNVMNQIPGYISDLKSIGSVKSFKKWELEARNLGYNILFWLLANRISVFFDHTASFAGHVELLRFSKKIGFTTKMIQIVCSEELIKNRIIKREKLSGRHTPLSYIGTTRDKINQLLPKYKEVVDEFSINS